MSRSFARSLALFERASAVIPGGIYGHTNPAATLPMASPYYAVRSEGCRYWDADDNEYLDFLCGYGPNVLGARHPEVEAAAEAQRVKGDCFNHPTPVVVDLAERLVALVDFAAWAVFGKNGSDMTTWALQVAREHTGRKKILMVHGAYHGSHAWCTPGHGGLIEEDYAHIHGFPWNDLDAFEKLLREHRGQVAGVIITPFHHPAFGDSALPAPGFLKGIEAACRREGAVLILDDVRCGFRLHMGGSHRFFGFEPDLICFSKALANGHPLSAALGRKNSTAPPDASSSPARSGTTPCPWPPRWPRSMFSNATTCPRTSRASARTCARACNASPPNTARRSATPARTRCRS